MLSFNIKWRAIEEYGMEIVKKKEEDSRGEQQLVWEQSKEIGALAEWPYLFHKRMLNSSSAG